MSIRDRAGYQVASDQMHIFGETFCENPLVTGAAGATLIAAGCTTLTGAMVLSVFMLFCLPIVGVIACREQERLSTVIRPAFYVAVTSAVVFVLSLVLDGIFRDSVTGVGIYAPLAAMNGLVMHRTWSDARILLTREAVVEGLACGLCFAVIALPVAFVRELLGGGALFGVPMGMEGIGELQLPFAGFILCGLLIALLRAFTGSGKGAAR